jgi:hypothetical protein
VEFAGGETLAELSIDPEFITRIRGFRAINRL